MAVCGLAIGLGFLAHVGYLSRAGFPTTDDMSFDRTAAYFRSHGFSDYGKLAFAAAKKQSRVHYLFTTALMTGPYYVDSGLKRALLISTVHALSWGCLAWFLAFYTGALDAWVLLGLLYCLLPYQRHYWPLASFPLDFSTGILLFFLGIGVYLRVWRAKPARRWLGLALALPALFLSLFVYESLTLLFCLITAAALWQATETPAGTATLRKLAAVARAHAPVIAVIVVYAVIYEGFRLRFPSDYAGTKVELGGAGLRTFLGVIWWFTVAGLPGVNFFLRMDGLADFWVDSPRWGEIVPFVVANLSTIGFLKAVLAAAAVYLLGTSRKEPSTPAAARGRMNRDVAIPLLAFGMAFLVQVPLAITPKYQHNPLGWAPYISGYFSFMCVTVAGWGVVRLLARKLAGETACPTNPTNASGGHALVAQAVPPAWRAPRTRSLLFGALAAALLLTSALNSIANQGVMRKHERQYARWTLIDAFLKTAAAREVPAGAVIIAPDLWEGFAESSWENKDDYWTEYLTWRTGRSIHVVEHSPDLVANLIRTGKLYCAQIQRTFDGAHALLMFAPIAGVEEGALSQGFLSDQVALIGDRDYKDAAVSMLVSEKAPEYTSVAGGAFQTGPLFHMPLAGFRRENGAYVAQVRRPGMVTGSWRLTSALLHPVERPLFEVTLGEGFSYMEAEGTLYWAWSDGRGGTGSISLVNRTETARAVQFEAVVRTASMQPEPFELAIQGRAESASLRNGEKLVRAVTLLPGSNEIRIHCRGPRIVAPNDPRYLVFGLENWKVTGLK